MQVWASKNQTYVARKETWKYRELRVEMGQQRHIPLVGHFVEHLIRERTETSRHTRPPDTKRTKEKQERARTPCGKNDDCAESRRDTGGEGRPGLCLPWTPGRGHRTPHAGGARRAQSAVVASLVDHGGAVQALQAPARLRQRQWARAGAQRWCAPPDAAVWSRLECN